MDLETFNALPSHRAVAELDENEVDAALAGHPRIGEHAAQASSRREQAGVLHERLGNDAATERGALRDELAKINRIRLGRLVCA